MNPKKPRKKCLNCKKECKNPQDKYCNNQCYCDYKRKYYIKRWLDGKETGNTGIKSCNVSGHIRRYFFEIKKNKCEICGWDKKNIFTKRNPLTLHHIDGDSSNTILANLQLLCPNCHSLTKTYGRRGKGRFGRGKYRGD